MSREPNEAAFASFLGRLESLDRTARPEDLLDFAHFTDLMDLPQVQVVGLESAQRFLEIRFGALSAALG